MSKLFGNRKVMIVLYAVVIFSLVNCQTMLMKAAKTGDIEMAKQGLAKGEKVNDMPKGTGPLHRAAENGFLDLVKFLLEKGADVNLVDKNEGKTPLQYAVLPPAAYNDEIHEQYRKKVDIASYLIKKGSDMKTVDRYGANLSLNAIGGDYIRAYASLQEKQKRAANMYKDRRNWMADDAKNYKSLVQSIENQKLSILESFTKMKLYDLPYENMLNLTVGSGVKARDFVGGYTVVHYAAMRGSYKGLDFLLGKGADVNAENDSGNTALHEVGADKKMYDYLLKKKADSHKKNYDGYTPYDMADWKINVWNAAGSNNVAQIGEYIKSGGSVNIYGNYQGISGWTPLHVAAYEGNHEAAGVLLGSKADVNAIWSPSAGEEEYKKIKFPFSFGSLTSGFKSLGKGELEVQTALHFAQKAKKAEMVSFLQSKGGSSTIKLSLKELAKFKTKFMSYPNEWKRED